MSVNFFFHGSTKQSNRWSKTNNYNGKKYVKNSQIYF